MRFPVVVGDATNVTVTGASSGGMLPDEVSWVPGARMLEERNGLARRARRSCRAWEIMNSRLPD